MLCDRCGIRTYASAEVSLAETQTQEPLLVSAAAGIAVESQIHVSATVAGHISHVRTRPGGLASGHESV